MGNCSDCEALWLVFTEARRNYANLRRTALANPGSSFAETARLVEEAEQRRDRAREQLVEHMGRIHKDQAAGVD